MNEQAAVAILKNHASAYGDSRYEPARWVVDAMLEAASTSKDAADAARYRYLRDNHVRKWSSQLSANFNAPSLDLDFSAEGHCLDAAIDRITAAKAGA